jgi:hypothetical protein
MHLPLLLGGPADSEMLRAIETAVGADISFGFADTMVRALTTAKANEQQALERPPALSRALTSSPAGSLDENDQPGAFDEPGAGIGGEKVPAQGAAAESEPAFPNEGGEMEIFRAADDGVSAGEELACHPALAIGASG